MFHPSGGKESPWLCPACQSHSGERWLQILKRRKWLHQHLHRGCHRKCTKFASKKETLRVHGPYLWVLPRRLSVLTSKGLGSQTWIISLDTHSFRLCVFLLLGIPSPAPNLSRQLRRSTPFSFSSNNASLPKSSPFHILFLSLPDSTPSRVKDFLLWLITPMCSD